MDIKEFKERYNTNLEGIEESRVTLWQCKVCGEWEIKTTEGGKSAAMYESQGLYPVCELCIGN